MHLIYLSKYRFSCNSYQVAWLCTREKKTTNHNIWCTKLVTHHISNEQIKVPCSIKRPQNIPRISTDTLLTMECNSGHAVRACTAFVMGTLPSDFWSGTWLPHPSWGRRPSPPLFFVHCGFCPSAVSGCKLEKLGVLLNCERLWASSSSLSFIFFLGKNWEWIEEHHLPVVLQPVPWARGPSRQPAKT